MRMDSFSFKSKFSMQSVNPFIAKKQAANINQKWTTRNVNAGGNVSVDLIKS